VTSRPGDELTCDELTVGLQVLVGVVLSRLIWTGEQALLEIVLNYWHDYTIGTLDVLKACDACALRRHGPVVVHCTDCLVFAKLLSSTNIYWQNYQLQTDLNTPPT